MKISDNKIETKLQKDYRASCEKYIKAFEKRHDVSFEFWVGDEIGGVASFGDYFFNLTDIINDVNSDDSTELIFEWYNACMEHEDWVNYDSYRRGYRYPADAPKKVYGFLKDKPSKPLSELHKDTETCEEFIIPGDCTLWLWFHVQGSLTDREFIKEYCDCKPQTYHEYEKELFKTKQTELKTVIEDQENRIKDLEDYIEMIHAKYPQILTDTN